MYIVVTIIVLFMLLTTMYLIDQTYRIRNSVYDISKNSRFSILQLSDIHGRLRYFNGRLSDVVNKLNPDCVVVTGDLATKKKQLTRVYEELAKIKCDTIIVILGNYERETALNFKKRKYSQAEINDMVISLQSLGIIVLINDFIKTEIEGKQLLIYGFDNSIYGFEQLNSNVKWDDNDYVIVLAHSPNIIKLIESHKVDYDLLLTGHTHGGQIRLFNRSFGAYKYYHTGMRKLDSRRHFYIHKGLGTVKIPFRFACPPEIAVFRF